ncbi:MAG: hypothetical protein WC352_01955 [Candidatus Omnitrophota bacterium]|jgi:hypothetical protein
MFRRVLILILLALAPYRLGFADTAAVPPEEKAATEKSIPAAGTAGSGAPRDPAQWADFYQDNPNAKLAVALWDAVTNTGVLARNVGDSIAGYVKDRQLQTEQRELLDRFYAQCQDQIRPLNLSLGDSRELMQRIERAYIEDSEKGTYRLDIRTFRDLPNLVKKEYAEMLLPVTRDGMTATFYPSGAVKTRWRYKGGRPEGPIVTYYETGDILYIDYYRDGEKISRRKYDPEGKLEFEQAYAYDPVPLNGQAASTPAAPAADAA